MNLSVKKMNAEPVVVLAIGILLAASLFAGTASDVHARSVKPCVQYTKEGVKAVSTGVPRCSRSADGLHVNFEGRSSFEFSLDGELYVPTISSPEGANGFEIEFAERKASSPCKISKFIWTQDGEKKGGTVEIPTANDLHFRLIDSPEGSITKIKWTREGKTLKIFKPTRKSQTDGLTFFCK